MDCTYIGDDTIEDVINQPPSGGGEPGGVIVPTIMVAAYGIVPENNFWKSVCYGNDKFVAVASNGVHRVMWSNTQGICWNLVEVPLHKWESICFDGTKFIAVGRDEARTAYSRSMVSTNGIDWVCNEGQRMILNTVCSNKNGFSVAAANASTACTFYNSSDGLNWIPSTSSASYINDICYAGDRFIAISSNCNYYTISLNGTIWETPVVFPSNKLWSAICYNSYYDVVTIVGKAGIAPRIAFANGRMENFENFQLPNPNDTILKTYTNGYFGCVCSGSGPVTEDLGSSCPPMDYSIITAVALDQSLTTSPKDYVEFYKNPTTGLTNMEFGPIAAGFWESICYGDGVFVAVSSNNCGVFIRCDRLRIPLVLDSYAQRNSGCI